MAAMEWWGGCTSGSRVCTRPPLSREVRTEACQPVPCGQILIWIRRNSRATGCSMPPLSGQLAPPSPPQLGHNAAGRLALRAWGYGGWGGQGWGSSSIAPFPPLEPCLEIRNLFWISGTKTPFPPEGPGPILVVGAFSLPAHKVVLRQQELWGGAFEPVQRCSVHLKLPVKRISQNKPTTIF